MIDVVGVQFKPRAKTYHFASQGQTYKKDDQVIVQMTWGLKAARVVIENKEIAQEDVVGDLKPVLRKMTEEDLKAQDDNKKAAKEALPVCQELVEKHGLDMKLIDSEYTFDRSKLLFYFTSDGRVDFRALVRDLARIYRTRIELRQVGVRDEAKLVGGLGSCGRPCCCATFLQSFEPVTIKMAKDQDLSLNSTKISGVCGRLMCCLRYEQEGYECLHKIMPFKGELVKTDKGPATVKEVYLIEKSLDLVYHDQDRTKEKVGVKDIKRTHKKDPQPAWLNLEDLDDDA